MAPQGRWEGSVLGDSTVVRGSRPTRRKESASNLSTALTDVGGVFADIEWRDGRLPGGGVA